MKRRMILYLLVIAIFLSACSFGEAISNEDIADGQMDLLLEAIQNRSTHDLSALFAKSALAQIGDMDAMMAELFAYCPDQFGEYDNLSALNTETDVENGRRTTRMYCTYDVETENGKLRFAFLYVSEDTEHPQNVGIWSLYVIDGMDDTEPEFAYRGDGQYTPGIHTGVKNTLPPEDA